MTINPMDNMDIRDNNNFDVRPGICEYRPDPIDTQPENDFTLETYDVSRDSNPCGRGGGTLSVQEHTHEIEPRQNNHLGNGEDDPRDQGGGAAGSGDDDLVNVEKTIERFRETTRNCLKDSTRVIYIRDFRRFAREVDLEQYTRRQLKGKRGKDLIMKFMETTPLRSRRKILASLRAFWTAHGLNLSWPIDTKIDLGRLPRPRREETPQDTVVKAWAETMDRERDVYLKLLWLLVAEHGWRPSHVAKIKWRNLRYDDEGRPVAIVACGAEEDFKTHAPVAARLCTKVQEAFMAWARELGEVKPENPVLPWRGRSSKKQVVPSKQVEHQHFIAMWKDIRKKWGLPTLRPKDMRHWVASACRRSGLSKQASAYLMGHDSAAGGSMRDWYDTPQVEDAILEQAQYLPDGALGILEEPEIQVAGDLPPEAVKMLQEYLAGNVSTLEFANRMEAIRMKIPEPVIRP